MNSLYIHIPFCIKKCHYCSFISFENNHHLFDDYFRALNFEIKEKTKNKKLKTVYIGGGTPSIVPINLYENLSFNLHKEYEFSFEINPKTVDLSYLKRLREIGINRLSIGVQSFDNQTLKNIGRLHNVQDSLSCIKNASKAGFKNINIDLIYGLPKQSLKNWHKTLKEASDLNIQHISTYGLKIEEGTPFAKKPPENLPDEEECANMYIDSIKILENKGFNHYEISNFCKKGFESKHNLNYWKNFHYIACGVSAHGYENKIRYENTSDINYYIKEPLKPFKENKLSQKDIIEETIFLGLRTKKGICLSDFKKRYKVDFIQKYSYQLKKYREFFHLSKNYISLNQKGFLLSNNILSEFME